MSHKQLVEVWTDGSCDNKADKRIGGIGIVMKYGSHTKEISEGPYSDTTSARMEIQAVITALHTLKPGFKIHIHCDNQYVQKTVEEGWLESWIDRGILDQKKNSDLWRTFREIYQYHIRQGSIVKLIWVKGHDGNVHNERADKLANEGRLKQ